MVADLLTPGRARRRAAPPNFYLVSAPGTLVPDPGPKRDPEGRGGAVEQMAKSQCLESLVGVDVKQIEAACAFDISLDRFKEGGNDPWVRQMGSSYGEVAAEYDKHRVIETCDLQQFSTLPQAGDSGARARERGNAVSVTVLTGNPQAATSLALVGRSPSSRETQQQHNQAAIHLVESWLLEDSDAVDEAWDLLRVELDSDRAEGRRLFP